MKNCFTCKYCFSPVEETTYNKRYCLIEIEKLPLSFQNVLEATISVPECPTQFVKAYPNTFSIVMKENPLYNQKDCNFWISK